MFVLLERSGLCMRKESLSYFLEIARVGSFSAAARNLYVSQQGLSKSILALEKELGVSLFTRSGKRVRLTDAGRELVLHARTLVGNYEAMREAMRKHAGHERARGKMHLLAMPFISIGLFNVMKEELTAYGLRDVFLAERDISGILEEILCPADMQGKVALIDISHKMLRCMLQASVVTFVPLFEASMMLAATKEFISPRKKYMTVREVAALPLVHYNEPMLDCILKDMFADEPFKNTILHTTNSEMLNEYVGGGQAVTFSDTFSAYKTAGKSNVLSIPIRGAASFSVGFVYATAKQVDSETLAYIDAFKTCIEETCQGYLAKYPVATA